MGGAGGWGCLALQDLRGGRDWDPQRLRRVQGIGPTKRLVKLSKPLAIEPAGLLFGQPPQSKPGPYSQHARSQVEWAPIALPNRKPAAPAAPMARLSQTEVLRRYQAGERYFRGADLRSLRFRGATLVEADFSGADLRGTDFLNADLRRAKFVGARCGLPRILWLGQGVMGMAFGLFAVYIHSYGIGMINLYLFFSANSLRAHAGMPVSIGVGVLLLAGMIAFAWQGFNSKGTSSLVIVAFAFACAVAVAVNGVGAGHGAFFGLTAAGDIFVALVFAITIAAAAAAATATTVAVAATPAAVVAFAVAVAVTFAVPGVVALSVSILLITWWRARRGSPGYGGCRSFGIALSSIGATRFSGADLCGAFFTDALLARANFAASRRQNTRLECVSWNGAKGLELARPGPRSWPHPVAARSC